LLVLLALGAYATRSFGFFDERVLVAWAVLTPILQWLAPGPASGGAALGGAPGSRRTAVVVGASALGVKAARALQESDSHGVDFVGYFDDRTDGRLDSAARSHILGRLTNRRYVAEHGVRDVYITLPLGSQPRIVALLEQLQGTTASLFFVPTCSVSASSRAGCRT
jgi:putative colanic acid biosynthesis UDP-glucose lipid carrier transferase